MKRVVVLLPAVGLGLASVFGFAGGQWWLFDLFSHFRAQYMLAAAFLILIYCWFKVWRLRAGKVALVLSFIFFILNFALVLQFYVPIYQSSRGSADFTVLFSNTYYKNEHPQDLLPFIKKVDPDVVALTEITKDQFTQFQTALHDTYPYSYFEVKQPIFTIALLSKTSPVNQDTVQYFSADAVPSLQVDIKKNEKPIRVIVTHPYPPENEAYTQQRNRQLLGMADAVKNTDLPLLIVGDFNNTPWSPIFQQMLHSGNLRNSMVGFGSQPSWPTWAPPFARIPIDQGLTNDKLEVVNRYRGPDIGSDHLPIVVQVRFK